MSSGSKRECSYHEAGGKASKQMRFAEDDPPPSPQQPAWRRHPSESFSDWKIEIDVIYTGDVGSEFDGSDKQDKPEVLESQATVYHVHKCILPQGNRPSQYFARMFHSQFVESKDSTSKIKLDPLAAKVFPRLLDYVYASHLPLQITMESAAALCHLGDYFEMPHLCWDVKQVCKKTLSVDNVHVLYQNALHFQDRVILDIVTKFLGENIVDVEPRTCPILNLPHPELWLESFQYVDPDDESANERKSKIVAKFVDNHQKTLDAATFDLLTHDSVLPIVSCNAAFTLCNFDDIFHGDHDNGQLSPLQKRCVTALSSLDHDQWSSFLGNAQKLDKLKARKPSFLAELLVEVLQKPTTGTITF